MKKKEKICSYPRQTATPDPRNLGSKFIGKRLIFGITRNASKATRQVMEEQAKRSLKDKWLLQGGSDQGTRGKW
jgi:hypothetical protein